MTVARENFLDKLKREREEAAARGGGPNAATNSGSSAPTELIATRPALPVLASVAKKTTTTSSSEESSSSSESDDDDAPNKPVAPVVKQVRQAAAAAARAAAQAPNEADIDEDGNLLLRKRSKAFLENGRIRIDASSTGSGGAIHVIERNRSSAKPREAVLTDDKSKAADKKRLESLGKMKDTYNQQKLAIKNALSGVDGGGLPRSNKIVFDAEPGTAAASQTKPSNGRDATATVPKKGKPLFDEDDEDDGDGVDHGNDFRVREQYQGERGEQLMRLQSRFKNDPRFVMDSKFLEDGNDDDEGYGRATDAGPQQPDASATDADDERKWQYGILESVMGKRIQSEPSAEKRNALPQTMLRYDPTKQDHTKYLATGAKRKAPDGADGKAKKSKQSAAANGDAADAEEAAAERPAFEVSKEQFYKVNKSLLKSSAEDGGAFSLLSMFGTANADTNSAVSTKNAAYRETLLATSATQKTLEDMTNPFKYDTSDDEQQVPDAQKTKQQKSAPALAAGKVAAKKSTTAVYHEPFFMLSVDDERLKEALAFYQSVESAPLVDEIALENRQKEMRNVLKKKVKRSIRSALPHGAKPNKRFRKFVRHL